MDAKGSDLLSECLYPNEIFRERSDMNRILFGTVLGLVLSLICHDLLQEYDRSPGK
jgi:hypothetical protein